jgi:hypothetical protein
MASPEPLAASVAIEFKRRSSRNEPDDEQKREQEARTRRKSGLETLTDDEELIDDNTFSEMHDELSKNRLGGADTQPVLDGLGPDLFEDEDELLLEEIATELPAQTDVVAKDCGPPADSAAVAILERQIADAKDRDEVAALTLRIARYHARVAALFVVNQGLVAGLCGSGEGLENRLEGIMIPTSADSLMARPLETGELVRGGAPPGSVDQRVLRAMGRDAIEELAVLPICIGKRVVNLLYVDNGSGPLAKTSLAALRVLCAAVGRVYERLILERKRSGRASNA